MKKYILFLIIAMFIVPVAYSNYLTDFSRPWLQPRCYSGGEGNCFSTNTRLLRSTSGSTGMDISSENWGACSVSLGGSKYGGVPISYYDYSSEYEFHAVLVLEESSLEVYDANCTSIVGYSINGDAVSQLGVINKGYVGTEWDSPLFAFAYNKSSDSKIYLRIYQLRNESVEGDPLRFLDEVLIGDDNEWGYYDKNMGVAGGGYESTDNNPKNWKGHSLYLTQ